MISSPLLPEEVSYVVLYGQEDPSNSYMCEEAGRCSEEYGICFFSDIFE